jgi:hypothetical protein
MLVAALVAMLILAGVATTVVWRSATARQAADLMPMNPMPESTVVGPDPALTPSVADTATYPAPPPTPHMSAWTSSPAGSLPGTTVFLDNSNRQIRVKRLAHNVFETATILPDGTGADCLSASSTLSPDGQQLAYVVGGSLSPSLLGSGADSPGTLFVTRLDTGATSLIARGVQCVSATHPLWIDNRSLRIYRGEALGRIDILTHAFIPLPSAWSGYVAVSADGRLLANRDQVQRMDGTVVRTVPALPVGVQVTAISPDGRYLGTQETGGAGVNPVPARGADRVIDLATGADVTLAALLGLADAIDLRLEQVVFLADGTRLVLAQAVRQSGTTRWSVLSPVNAEIGTLVNPPVGFEYEGPIVYVP